MLVISVRVSTISTVVYYYNVIIDGEKRKITHGNNMIVWNEKTRKKNALLNFGPIKRNTRPEEETLLGSPSAHRAHNARTQQPKGHFSVFFFFFAPRSSLFCSSSSIITKGHPGSKLSQLHTHTLYPLYNISITTTIIIIITIHLVQRSMVYFFSLPRERRSTTMRARRNARGWPGTFFFLLPTRRTHRL